MDILRERVRGERFCCTISAESLAALVMGNRPGEENYDAPPVLVSPRQGLRHVPPQRQPAFILDWMHAEGEDEKTAFAQVGKTHVTDFGGFGGLAGIGCAAEEDWLQTQRRIILALFWTCAEPGMV
jgi:hypothetical protein